MSVNVISVHVSLKMLNNPHSPLSTSFSPIFSNENFVKFSFFFFFIFLQTSASLKFTVLNPKGRIWTMVAGGGASVIYADTVWFSIFGYRISMEMNLFPCLLHLH